ncbi:MAG TPA: enoyl-CoA hydratase/isomerase family protein, partial [Stellaceae bacterium]|nr:enoyl-CoA hydratase/isomerase family protein [Stellaceae bacterium]
SYRAKHKFGEERATMTYETILYERRGTVALITLNRPQRLNAMNGVMLRELHRAMDAAEGDAEVRAVVLAGAGSGFCSGFDLKEQAEAKPSGVAQWRPLLQRDFDAIMRFWRSPKPTIAAVRGPCLAGGCELALACDITVAAEDAMFGEPELRFGAGIVVMLLPWLIGPKRAKQLLFTGDDKITARRAEAIGLVNEVVATGEELARALHIAADLSVIDAMALRETKRAVNRTYEIMGMGEALEAALDIDLQIEGEGTADKRQFMEIARCDGLRAAIAWRDARFAAGKTR